LIGEKRGYYPTLELVSIYSVLGKFNNYNQFFKTFQRNNFNAGVDVQVPIFSAQTKANIALAEAGLAWLPVRRSWRLNERHYGALQGKDKAATRREFGDEQFMLWRRSYDVPPPPIADDDPLSQSDDPRYAALPPDARPRTECLKDVVARMLPYWYDAVVPDLNSGTTMIVAHGNSLRALVKHLDGISDAAIAELNIPTGIPLVYELDDAFRPEVPGGRYLDPEAAAEAAEAVKNQGR